MMLLLKKRVWLTLVLLLSLILIIRAVPAGWLVFFVQQSLPGLKVQGVSGTIWQGSFDNSVLQERGSSFPLGSVNWVLKPLSLLTLTPCVDLSARAAPQNITGEFCFGLLGGQIALNDVSVNLPLANISPLLEVDVRGNINGQVSDLTWDGERFGTADARLLWSGGQINNGSQWIALGDLQARSHADEQGDLATTWSSLPDGRPPLTLQLTTLLSGLSAEPRIKVDGSINLTPQTRALRPMLQFIGSEVSSNSFRVSMNEPL